VQYKCEYLAGRMYARAGANAWIIANIGAQLWAKLRGRGCRAFTTDLRLSICASGSLTYSDVMVICGPVEKPAGANDIVVNPKLIIEVLSNSAKNYDRGEKFPHHRRIPGSSEYLLAVQDSVRVKRHVLQADGSLGLARVHNARRGYSTPADHLYS
jgi:Uma2 family endonuclease